MVYLIKEAMRTLEAVKARFKQCQLELKETKKVVLAEMKKSNLWMQNHELKNYLIGYNQL